MVLERSYNVPLRKEFMKVPRHKRAKKASKALKEFIVKHMKSEDVIVSNTVNEKIWEKGIRKPPHHVLVDVVKDDDGHVIVTLPEEKVKKEKKAEKKKSAKKSIKKEVKKPVKSVTKKEPVKKEEKSKADKKVEKK